MCGEKKKKEKKQGRKENKATKQNKQHQGKHKISMFGEQEPIYPKKYTVITMKVC